MGVSLRKSAVIAGWVAPWLLLAGCGSFFNPSVTSTGPGSGTGAGTGGAGAVYLANLATQDVTAFAVANGKLVNLQAAGALGSVPASLAINPTHTLLWVGTTLGSVYAYNIGSNGALTLNSGLATTAFANAILVDPSGRYLLIASDSGLNAAPVLSAYTIDTGNGALSPVNGGTIALTGGGSASQLTFAPTGNILFAALGTAGVDELTFNVTTGVPAEHAHLNPGGNSYADTSVAVDPTGQYLFVAETGTQGVRALTIAPNGGLSEIKGSPYPTGAGPSAVLVSQSGANVYVANRTNGTISQFALDPSGALTPLATASITTGATPASLTEDSSGTFILAACSGGNPDLQMFSIGTDGSLTSVQTVNGSSGTATGAIAVVATPPAG